MKQAFNRQKRRFNKIIRPVARFIDDINKKNLTIMSAGIAYYALLAVFPAMATIMAVVLFVLEPSQVETAMNGLRIYVPKEIVDMLSVTLSGQAGQETNLIMAGIGIVFALFGASGVIVNTNTALNAVYNKKETRSLVRLHFLSIVLTIGGLCLVAIVVAMLSMSYMQLVNWGVPEWSALIISILRWPLTIILINIFIMLLFRYGANRERSAWKITTPGATLATFLWLLVTVLFFGYLQNYAGFTRSYSIFAGIIALMIWFNFSAIAILSGALFDARRKVM